MTREATTAVWGAPFERPARARGTNAPTTKPLSGGMTRPLTAHALRVLMDLSRGPAPSQIFNPGVVARLLRGALVQCEDLPSPYKSH